MASKKAPIDPLKTQFKALKEINQRLKNICDVYYISQTGKIYMHSLVPFIEKIAELDTPEDISLYSSIMYLPNQLFEFTKVAKSTKLLASETSDSINLGQEDSEEHITLNKIYVPNPDSCESEIVSNVVIPQMYHQLQKILINLHDYVFIDIGEEDTLDIINNQMISIADPSGYIALTKNLFPSIKKGDSLQYTILPMKDDRLKEKRYVLFKKKTSDMTIYTLCAYLTI